MDIYSDSSRKIHDFDKTTGTTKEKHKPALKKRNSVRNSAVFIMSIPKESEHNDPTPELRTFSIKLGWIQGVLIPCLLNIWGVMLFLRIAWVVAQAGIALSLVIIGISGTVCIITTLSLSAICTNGVVQGGGVYYLVSRSLGAELGASVGIIFAFANAIAASMNTIGFCDSLNDLLRRYNARIIDNDINDVRIVGSFMLLLMCIICAIGMDWETKTQNFLIVVILLAISNFIIGACVGPLNDKQRARGFMGIKVEVASQNWKPDFRRAEGSEQTFFRVFAIYFPAVTGVQAGANICGDLRDPARAIPKGTLLAVLISTTSYAVMAVLCGVAALRDASGDVTHVRDQHLLTSCTPHCDYGLHNSYEMMQLMALWDLLIFFGCWAATLSTALTNLLAVPRLIQALGQDQIYPGLKFFAKPYGRHGEPYRGYVITYIVSLSFLLIADLNRIAPLITNFYLASYALINFCTFHADFIKHISWRPQFRFYNKWLSLLGFIACVNIMILTSWIMALATLLIFLTFYLLVLYRKPAANWGSSREAQQYRDTVTYLLNLTLKEEAVKSYNPQFLVLAGRPYLRPALLDIAHIVTKRGSFMIVADIESNVLSQEDRRARFETGHNWIIHHKYRGFYVLLDNHDLQSGVTALLQTAGLGRLSPNILLIGYMSDWFSKPHEDILLYYRALQNAYELNAALTILRSCDTEHVTGNLKNSLRRAYSSKLPNQMQTILSANSDEFITKHSSISHGTENAQSSSSSKTKKIDTNSSVNENISLLNSSDHFIDHKPLMQPVYFPEENGVIDAWWLYDDGGLNILLPYIISRRGFKDTMQLRIFALPKNSDIEPDKMAQLLAKFRIEYEKLSIISGLWEEPSQDSWSFFNKIIANFKTDGRSDTLITDEELERLHSKTSRYLRLRELIMESSSEATLIVLTLPLPRKGKVSAAFFMAWLEVLSQGLPPILFVRGNTASVIAT